MTGEFIPLERGTLDLGIWSDDYIRTASLSADGVYRYRLGRMWDVKRPTMGWVMLNPSTADAQQDDTTIRRCVQFAKREGCGSIDVVNLFAYRATDPRELATVEDPIGPDNHKHIASLLTTADLVVVAWGAHRVARYAINAITSVIEARGGIWCLGTTADGSPCHPSRIAADTKLVLWHRRLS